MRIAILDLGSTSFHALVVDIDTEGGIERVFRRSETLHLAAAAVEGHVPSGASFRALQAARALRKSVDGLRPYLVLASATSALRDASNGNHLLERLEIAVRSPIRVLGGDEEAELAHRGATTGLGTADERVLVADLGGGSLDIAVGRGDEMELTATFPLGASRLTALHISTDPPAPDELAAIESAVMTSCAGVFDRLRPVPPRCVVSGGTGRAIARLTLASSPKAPLNGLQIPTAALHRVCRQLTTASRRERAKIPGIATKRVDVLPAGALVLSCLADGLDAGSITISECGLREGLLLEVTAEYGSPLRLAR